MSYCSDKSQCYAYIIYNTHNSSLNPLYLACKLQSMSENPLVYHKPFIKKVVSMGPHSS